VKDINELPEWARAQIRQRLAKLEGLEKPVPRLLNKVSSPDQQSEKEFMKRVVGLAKLTGWLCYHTFDSRRSSPGFPDLVLVRPPDIIFAELKNNKGKLSDKQWVWHETLKQCPGVSFYLWRPQDWESVIDILQTKP
jgi:hypothetical protein